MGDRVREAWSKARVRIPDILRLKKIKQADPMTGTSKIWPTFGEKAEGMATIAHWHIFKEYLDEQIQKMKGTEDRFAKIDLGELGALYDDINRVLKKNENYKRASSIWAGHARMKEAFDDGIKAHKDNTLPTTEILRSMRGLKTVPEQKSFRLGYAKGMYNKIVNVNQMSPNIKKALKLFSEEEPEKIKALFGNKDTAEKFLHRISLMGRMDAMGKKALGGSPTYRRQAMERMLKGSPSMVTRGVNLARKLKNVGELTTTAEDILANKRFEEKLSALSPIMHTSGTEKNRRIIQDLIAEREKIKRMMNARAGFAGVTPGTFAPFYGSEVGQMATGAFDMGAGSVSGLLTPETYKPR